MNYPFSCFPSCIGVTTTLAFRRLQVRNLHPRNSSKVLAIIGEDLCEAALFHVALAGSSLVRNRRNTLVSRKRLAVPGHLHCNGSAS